MGMIERQVEDVNVIEPLDNQGEALFKKNLHEGETVLVKLKGAFGQAFVVTDSHVYILKYGFMAGHTFGGQCVAYGFNQITGIEIRKSLATGVVEVLTAADKNTRGKTYWGQGKESATEADNMVSFQVYRQGQAFQLGVSIARETIQKALNARTPPVVEQQSAADEIEKLALLRDKGIVTEEEFQAKKRRLLGL
jgi:hypothetical protein